MISYIEKFFAHKMLKSLRVHATFGLTYLKKNHNHELKHLFNSQSRVFLVLHFKAASFYLSRKVIRDVTRLLYILNKKPSRLQMPPDGLELMKWSKKILRKYESTQVKQNAVKFDAAASA